MSQCCDNMPQTLQHALVDLETPAHPSRGASSWSAPAAEPLCSVDMISTQAVSADTTLRTLRARVEALEGSASSLRSFCTDWLSHYKQHVY